MAMYYVIEYEAAGHKNHTGLFKNRNDAERELARLKKKYPNWKFSELVELEEQDVQVSKTFAKWGSITALVMILSIIFMFFSQFVIPAIMTGTLSGCLDRLAGAGYRCFAQGSILDVRFVDEVGTPFGIKNADGKQRVSANYYTYDIAEGNVADHYPMRKFGYNADVGATEEDIWEGSAVYNYLGAATSCNVSSTDVDDNGVVPDTGARTITIYGLDGNYDEVSESLTLNGQNGVLSTNQYLRIYRMIVNTAGTTGSNEGTVYAGTGAIVGGVPANIINLITPGHNQTLMALYTVPRNHTGYITALYTSTGINNKTTEILLYVRPQGEVFQLKKRYHILAAVVEQEFKIPLEVEEMSDIAVRAMAIGGGGTVSASFDMWYERN